MVEHKLTVILNFSYLFQWGRILISHYLVCSGCQSTDDTLWQQDLPLLHNVSHGNGWIANHQRYCSGVVHMRLDLVGATYTCKIRRKRHDQIDRKVPHIIANKFSTLLCILSGLHVNHKWFNVWCNISCAVSKGYLSCQSQQVAVKMKK